MHTFFTPLRRAARSAGLVTIGVLSTLGTLSLSHIGPVLAQSPGVNLAQLVAIVNALKSQQAVDEQTITSQHSMITALQAETAPLSVSGTDFTITGVNVHIIDGSGFTDDGTGGEVSGAQLMGLGNLIIGYNGADNDHGAGDVHTGSHNLIFGDQNNYKSYGGLIGGKDSNITEPYASVLGGYNTAASGSYAMVSGGYANITSGNYSTVSGGNNNTADGGWSSVSGGNGLIEVHTGGWSAVSYTLPIIGGF